MRMGRGEPRFTHHQLLMNSLLTAGRRYLGAMPDREEVQHHHVPRVFTSSSLFPFPPKGVGLVKHAALPPGFSDSAGLHPSSMAFPVPGDRDHVTARVAIEPAVRLPFIAVEEPL